jgi:hypothetical protein
MLNLDGSRTNAARDEPELFIRLQEPGCYGPLYDLVLKAARLEGFSPAQVPDFLGAFEGDDPLEMLGQEELGPVQVTTALDELFEQQGRWELRRSSPTWRRSGLSSSVCAWRSIGSTKVCLPITSGHAASAGSRPAGCVAMDCWWRPMWSRGRSQTTGSEPTRRMASAPARRTTAHLTLDW